MKRMFDAKTDDIKDGVQNVRDVLELVALAFRWRESDGWLDLSPNVRNGLLLLLESLAEVLDDITNAIQERDVADDITNTIKEKHSANHTSKPKRTSKTAQG